MHLESINVITFLVSKLSYFKSFKRSYLKMPNMDLRSSCAQVFIYKLKCILRSKYEDLTMILVKICILDAILNQRKKIRVAQKLILKHMMYTTIKD